MGLPASRLTELNTWSGPDQIELVDRWHDDHDDPAARRGRRRSWLSWTRTAMRPPLCRCAGRRVRKRRGRRWRISTDLCRKSPCRPSIGCPSGCGSDDHHWLRGSWRRGVCSPCRFRRTPLAGQSRTRAVRAHRVLRPQDGHTVDFEAGYIRHLELHRQAKDAWAGMAGPSGPANGNAGSSTRRSAIRPPAWTARSPRPRTSGTTCSTSRHTPSSLANALYEYLPALSRGSGVPTPTARLELTTVDLTPGAATAFEAALRAGQSTLQGETLWYRMVAGGTAPRYVRLRPRPSLSAILDGAGEQALPEAATPLIAKTTVEILTLRPTMSYGLRPARI